MLAIITVSVCSFIASLVTLFSGFGLGTILMPVVAIFFPVPIAVAITAFVHLLNNICKLILLRSHIDWKVTLKFGLPAAAAAVPGAIMLNRISAFGAIHEYDVAGIHAQIIPVKLAAGILLIIFATAEASPLLKRFRPSVKALPLGGILSGFFGGLSGHQGAFRSAFLISSGMGKESFVGTNAAIASLVDISRLLIYGFSFGAILQGVENTLLASATITAFAGAFVGTVWLKKITLDSVQKIVAAMLYLLGVLLILGLI